MEPSLGSVGREVVDLANVAGLELDPWQVGVLEGACHRSKKTYFNKLTGQFENKWSAYEVGVMISRQNGKGSILEARELAGMYLFGERLIIHSAHQFDTSREHFDRILGLIESTPVLDKEVLRVGRSHGDEEIVLFHPDKKKFPRERKRPGSRLKFRTRTSGGGRGFTGDCLVFDEAMILDSGMVRALMPSLVARPNSQIWYMGSAGDKKSTQFGAVRNRGMSSGPGGFIGCEQSRLAWFEWSIEPCTAFCPVPCDQHLDPNDPLTWAIANASMGLSDEHGVQFDGISADFESMTPRDFAWEHLGVGDWPVDGNAWLIIPKPSWMARQNDTSAIVGKFALGVDTQPDRSTSCLSAAGVNQFGRIHVEITSTEEQYDHRPGTQWVVPRILEIWRRPNRPEFVVIDAAGQAGDFVEELEKAGVKVVSPTSREYAQSCGNFVSGVMPKQGETAFVDHLAQPPMNAAVAAADKRELTDLWAWSKKLSAADISPLVSPTLAMWGFKKHLFGKSTAAPWAMRR